MMPRQRSARGVPRVPRTSLLQRGRSFTAEDLAAVDVETLVPSKDGNGVEKEPVVETRTLLMPTGLCMTRSRSSSIASTTSNGSLAVPLTITASKSTPKKQTPKAQPPTKKAKADKPTRISLDNLGVSDGGLRSPFQG